MKTNSEQKSVEKTFKEGWVLQLKDVTYGEMYFDGSDIVHDISEALVIKNKDKYIEFLKKHEEKIFAEYGVDAICNAGYTNMMKNFKFVEVEYSYD